MTQDKLRDKLWRLQNLYLVRQKQPGKVISGGLGKFKFNRVQWHIVRSILPDAKAGRPIELYTLKARQQGVSTFWLLWYLDAVIFHAGKIAGILAHERITLGFLWDTVRIAHANMPSVVRPKIREDNASTLAFDGNNSKIIVGLKVHGSKLDHLHISEHPLCTEDQVKESLGACHPATDITYEGVSAGMNHAYDKYVMMKARGKALFSPWMVQEEFRKPTPGLDRTPAEIQLAEFVKATYGIPLDDEQIAWRRKQIEDLGRDFVRLYPEDDTSCWTSAGGALFNHRKLEVLLREAKTHLAEHPPIDQRQEYVMWHSPDSCPMGQPRFVAGGDVAEGLDAGNNERDWSVLAVLCLTCASQAFRYRARVEVGEFARVCNEWGRRYRKALLAVESNSFGRAVVERLENDLRYPNLYSEKKRSLVRAAKERIEYGWRTTSSNRGTVLNDIKLAIEGPELADDTDPEKWTNEITVFDIAFLQECFTFENVDGKLEAPSGKHDDLIFGWAICYQMFKRAMALSPSSAFSVRVGTPLESSNLFR